MQKIVRLRLYGEIDHQGEDGDMAWQLYQSQALTRLRDISLSSTPSRFAPHGMAASRFEHTVGVGFLARKLCDWRKDLEADRLHLLAAALCHDIGSPPFSHISELFLWDQSGRTHEEETARLLTPDGEIDQILRAYNVDAKRVASAVRGEDPRLGPLVAGSIDLDNIDNSLHLLVSLGYHDDPPYHPLRLLRAFRISESKGIRLDTSLLSEILGWQEGRRQLYDILHDEPNLSSSTMLYRALEYAYSGGFLEASFFRMGEGEAMQHLLKSCGGEASRLISLALRWKQYPLVFQSVSREEDPRLASLYDNWRERKRFTDRIAADLDIPRGEIALYIGRDRGEKAIDLPFRGRHSSEVSALFRYRPGKQRLAIFTDKSHSSLARSSKLQKAIEKATDQLAESDPEERHVFF